MISSANTGRSGPIERIFAPVVREFRHHTDPANHRPIRVVPLRHPVQRTLASFAGIGALALAGVGAITPIMPTWPFALLALFCFARSSRRVRDWVEHNRIISSVMSLLYSRSEWPFVWARDCLDRLMGSAGG
jgi:hypothetical protein